MWLRKRLDIGWLDLAAGAVGCLAPGSRRRALERLLVLWPRGDPLLACTSVRSGLDLLLGALALPQGSEVLVSAITIPDMVRIVRDHGLTPVPVDLDPRTAAPCLDSLERAISPRSRAVLVAHLFGGRIALGPIVELARRKNLVLIEDCAQAYAGPNYLGHSEADASLLSFGPIKTSTALGGAVARVRDVGLAEKMRRRTAKYPVQSRSSFARRLAKYAVLKACSARIPFSMLIAIWRWQGRDYDRLVNSTVRGYGPREFYEQLRRRPSIALVRLLARRIRQYDASAAAWRTRRGRLLAARLAGAAVCPAVDVEPHTFWVFPILVDDPAELIRALFAAGFDATQGQSMCVVEPPDDRPELAPTSAGRLLKQMVYLPFYPSLPTGELLRMADVVRSVCVKRPAPVLTADEPLSVSPAPVQST